MCCRSLAAGARAGGARGAEPPSEPGNTVQVRRCLHVFFSCEDRRQPYCVAKKRNRLKVIGRDYYSNMQRLVFTATCSLGPAFAFSGGASLSELSRCRLLTRMNPLAASPPRPIGPTDGSGKHIGALHLASSANANDGVDFDSLLDMDVVLFKRRNREKEELELGAMQEDGTVAPISAWSLESAFASGSSDSIEFLVDEEDRFPGLTADDIVVVSVVDEALISYGSRQVGGGKGPGNPHGEESELLYYVERSVIEEGDVDVVIKPELEILW